MKEEWRKIKNFDYEISNLGQVRSLDREIITKKGKIKILKGKIIKNQLSWDKKYYSIYLHKDKKIYSMPIHRLVAEYFIPNPNNYPIVNYLDENKFNNNANNLEWTTSAKNNRYSINKHPERKHTTKIIQYSLEGYFIKEWDSITEASKFYNINISSISNCLCGKSKSSGKYIWKYFCEDYPKIIEKYIRYKKKF